jgi:hypothetical protein
LKAVVVAAKTVHENQSCCVRRRSVFPPVRRRVINPEDVLYSHSGSELSGVRVRNDHSVSVGRWVIHFTVS